MSAGEENVKPGRCVFCGDAINPQLDFRKVVGWEQRRQAGGTNALRLRAPQDEWACRFCIDKQSRGLSATQGSLL